MSHLHPPVPHRFEHPVKKFFISGSVAFTFELCGGHYIEFAKILRQTSNMSYWEITKSVTKQKGIAGLLDGYFPWGAAQCFVKGASFGLGQSLGMKMLRGNTHDFAAEVFSGSVGGAVQGMVMSPLLLLKTRVMTDPSFRAKGGLWETMLASTKLGMDLVRREGAGVLLKGAGIFTLKRTGDWTTRFLFAHSLMDAYADAMTRWGPAPPVPPVSGSSSAAPAAAAASSSKPYVYSLSLSEKSACSFVGGMLSAVATIPVDVLVALVQDASRAGQQVHIADILRQELREHGVWGLMQLSTRGLGARVLHVGLTTMMMKELTSLVYKVFHD